MKIYYFSADWCGPCKTFKPIVERVLLNYPTIEIEYKVVDGEGMELAAKHQITKIPTIVAERKDFKPLVGVATEETLIAWLDLLTNP